MLLMDICVYKLFIKCSIYLQREKNVHVEKNPKTQKKWHCVSDSGCVPTEFWLQVQHFDSCSA